MKLRYALLILLCWPFTMAWAMPMLAVSEVHALARLAHLVNANESVSSGRSTPCSLPSVHSLNLSVDRQNTKTFEYRYQLISGTDPTTPLVIFIPGGPGRNSMNTRDIRANASYSLILTDPRGSGCNDVSEIHEGDITSESIANDLLALIQTLKPEHYIIHGHSFGTVVATMLSKKIADLKLDAPEAVILEGTVGRRTRLGEEGFGMASSWSRITPRFTPETRLKVEGQDKVPMGLQEPQWINVISSVTYFGEARWLGLDYENLLTASIREATGSAPKEFQLLDAISNYGSPLAEGEKTYNAIACNELFDHSHLKLKYANGNVTDTSQIRCEPTNLQPYDSARWQMRLRTVYVMGENDPSTSFRKPTLSLPSSDK